MTHTYSHRFRNGTLATATVNDDPPSFAVEWQGKVKRRLLAEYFAWRDSVLADFERRTGQRVLVVTLL